MKRYVGEIERSMERIADYCEEEIGAWRGW